MATRAGKKKVGISVDFTDVESSGVPEEGDVLLEVDEVSVETSENSGADYLKFQFKIDGGQDNGKKVWHNCSLQPQALFNLRNLLEALGLEVPTGVMDLDPQELVGEKCGASLVHEQYKGKTKAVIGEFFPADDLGGEPEEEKKPEPKPAKGKKEEVKEEPAPTTKKKVKKAAEPVLEVGSEVTFIDDEGGELQGKVTAMEDGNITVLVGKDEWELEEADVTLV